MRLTIFVISLIFSANIFAGETLNHVRENGFLRCGVSQGLSGFSTPSANQGQWAGLDVDYCRAVAAAVFGDPKKVRFTPLSAKERFTALQSGEIDILARNTTWTLSRDAALGLDFVGVIFYDGQGFMVPKSANVKSAKELDGATICTNAGTTSELNIADYFRGMGLKYELLTYEHTDETFHAYEAGRCDVYSTDTSGLAAQRLKLKNPDEHVVLPEIISKEPLSPMVRQGDDEWANIARWTLFALINAEELGISQHYLWQRNTKFYTPEQKRFLGLEGDLGERLGLKATWTHDVIMHVGNYKDIYERNLGEKTPMKLPRGPNQLWKNGGVLYAPPFR